MNCLQDAYQIHMIGIGGAGMCALARILKQMGYRVGGSDNNESDNLERLREEGIAVKLGHAAENIDGADLVVVSAAVLPDNPELLAAKSAGVKTVSRAELFGELSKLHRKVIALSGTHGKTTATSMLCKILDDARRQFTAVVGGYLPFLEGNGKLGGFELMVCEACEFADTFLSLKRDNAVILNIDEDHLEYFKTPQRLVESFRTFAKEAKTVLVCGDNERAMQAVEGMEAVTFGFDEGNEYRAVNLKMQGGFAAFDLAAAGQTLMHITLKVAGRHNVYNAMAAAVAAIQEGVPAGTIAASLAGFTGAARRFEVVGQGRGVTVADDYAHHPAEIDAVLSTAKQMNYRNIIAVFQPFTFSRTFLLMDEFSKVLSCADRVVLTPIMGSREVNTYGVTSQQLCRNIEGAVLCDDFDQTARCAVELAKEGDLILTLGCGDIYKAARKMVELLGKE